MSFMNLPVPNQLIDIGGFVLLLIIILGLALKIKRGVLHRFTFLNVFSSTEGANNIAIKSVSRRTSLIQSIANVFFYDVLTTRPLSTCNKIKRASHLAIFWGFAFTGVSTTLAYLMNPQDAILPLTHPVKIFGNLGGILLVAGFVSMFYVRYQENGSAWKITRSDYFLIVLFLTVITGFITQEAVYATNDPFTVAVTFWLHMVFIVLLLATAPFTKFGHAVFKPVWLLYEDIGKRRGDESHLPSPEVLKKAES